MTIHTTKSAMRFSSFSLSLLGLSVPVLTFQPAILLQNGRPQFTTTVQSRNCPPFHRSVPICSTASKEDFDVNLEDFFADDLIGSLGDEEQIGEPKGEPSVTDFVEMVEQTPVGELEIEEATLLKEIMASVATENDGDGVDAAPMVVERLLRRMIDEWEVLDGTDEELDRVLEPTAEDFVFALKTWETSTKISGKGDKNKRRKLNTQVLPTAVSHAWDLYITMEDLFVSGVVSLKPNAQVAEALLRVLSSSRERGIDRKCRTVFDDIQGKYGVSPTVGMYACLIKALGKSRDRGAANRAESMLRKAAERFPPVLIENGGLDENGRPATTGITIDSFNVVLTAWAKSSVDYGPERAEKLIFYMEELDQEYGGHGILRPSASSFTSLLDAYAQKLDWDSVSQAERIFNRLLDEYLDGEEELEPPSLVTWTVILSSWSKLCRKGFKGGANRAERLFNRLQDLHGDGRISFGPDAIVYISIMNAWAFSKTEEGPTRATELLNEMNEHYLDGDDSYKPSAKNIRVVIESWIRSGKSDAMTKAEAVLESFEDFLETLGESEQEQVTDVYKTMLFGWSTHGVPEQAHEYLLDMIDNAMEVDAFCFDRIIEGYTKLDDKDSFKSSQEVFELMEKCRRDGLVKPNERVYTSFMRGLVKAKVPNMAHKTYVLLQRMKDLAKTGENKGIEPTVFTYNAVMMACAETAEADSTKAAEGFKIAIKVFNELRSLPSKGQQGPDHVSFGNMLRCAALIPEGDQRDNLIRSTFQLCCRNGYVNEFVIRDLQSVTSEDLWRSILDCPPETEFIMERMPAAWARMSGEKPPAMKKDPDQVRKFRR